MGSALFLFVSPALRAYHPSSGALPDANGRSAGQAAKTEVDDLMADMELIALTLIFFGSCVWMIKGLSRLMGQ